MPPKRRPEQYDKNAGNKSRTAGTARRTPQGKPTIKQNQSPDGPSSRSIPQWRLPKSASAADYKPKIESLWKNMGNSRVGERQNAIKHGLMADPNKRTTLANAIRVVGTCQDMCPEFERIQRIRENAVDRAEKVAIYNGAKVPDELRMVKAFHRPDAGKEEQLPSDLRPPAILQKTVRYLFDKVASPSASLAEHHKFVWDRTRCIRNDFTIQASGRLEDIKIAIQCYEEIARFHILSLHQMPKIGKHDYDAQQELEQLSATLLSLFEYYDDNRGKYEAPREAEFRAYKLLIDIRSRTNDTFERVQTWPPRIRDSFHVQTAVQLCQASGVVFTNTASMLSPYSRAMRVEQAAYERFWSILESPKVDYLMACAASVSFNEIRARTLETMAKVYRSGPQSRLQDISLEELTFALGLDSKSQTRKLFRETGLHVSKHANGVSYLDLDELAGALPKAAIASSEQMFSRSIVEVKREDRVFSAVYSGFSTSHCKENGLIDESGSDAEFEPDTADLDSEDEEDESLFVDQDNEEDGEDINGSRPLDTQTVKNPFGFGQSREPSPQPATSSFGGFGQPSAPQPLNSTAGRSTSPFSNSNPFQQSARSANPFAQATATSTNPFASASQPNAPTKTGVTFGQSSNLFGLPQNSTAVSVPTETGFKAKLDTTAAPTNPFQPPTAGLFQQKATEPTAKQQVDAPTPSGLFGQISKPSDTTKEEPVSNESASGQKPLFPFTFPPTAKTDISTDTASSNPDSKPVKSIFDSKPSPTPTFVFSPPTVDQSSTRSSAAVQENPKAASSTKAPTAMAETTGIRPLFASSQEGSKQSIPAFTEHQGTLDPTNSAVPGTSSPKPVTGSPFAQASKESVEKVEKIKPTRPVVTPAQRDRILDMVAREMVLSENGILEQFIEAELGPIYDRAQRKVTKECTQARLQEIKESLLSFKFLHIWRLRVEEKLRRRKATQRRERMRQSLLVGSSRGSPGSDVSSSVQEGSQFDQSNGQLKYLTRGFHDTFDKSTSNHQHSPTREYPTLALPDGSLSALVKADAQAASRPKLHPQTRSRHSRSQTVDGTIRSSLTAPSSASMPPPNGFPRSKALARSGMSELKPFVGTGFLQSAALRREATDFARRSGSNTTTSSDYFRLKARNIDPDTKVIPSTRKRGRDSGEGSIGHLLPKTRRLSESTTSTISLSESTRELLARSGLSESTASLLNRSLQAPEIPVSGTATPRYTDEEDALFEAARKLRETLAEDTDWMRAMREEHNDKRTAHETETPAQKRLREFKATPSKTSIRLRATHANGLLPPDYFERQDASKRDAGHPRTALNGTTEDTPTRKMGLEALPDDRHHAKPLQSIGASVDDAIEL